MHFLLLDSILTDNCAVCVHEGNFLITMPKPTRYLTNNNCLISIHYQQVSLKVISLKVMNLLYVPFSKHFERNHLLYILKQCQNIPDI